jgi:hypothetical protein
LRLEDLAYLTWQEIEDLDAILEAEAHEEQVKAKTAQAQARSRSG